MPISRPTASVPKTIVKSVRDLIEISHTPDGKERKGKGPRPSARRRRPTSSPTWKKEMKEASRRLEFEYAAILRDQIIALKAKDTTD